MIFCASPPPLRCVCACTGAARRNNAATNAIARIIDASWSCRLEPGIQIELQGVDAQRGAVDRIRTQYRRRIQTRFARP